VNPEVPPHHAHDDDLQLYVLGRLNAAKVDVLERHVVDCAECKERLGTTAQVVAKISNLHRNDEGTDRRNEPRFHIADAVFLCCLAPALSDRWRVQIIDVSKNGLGLLAHATDPRRLGPYTERHNIRSWRSKVLQADQRTPISHWD
jgi:hypothetical protein